MTPTDMPDDNSWRPVVAGDGTAVLTSQVAWSTGASCGLVTGINGRSGPDWQFPGVASDGAAAFSAAATDDRRVFVCEAHATREEFVVSALRATTGGIEWLRRDTIDTGQFTIGAGENFRLCHPASAGRTVVAGYGTTRTDPGRGLLTGIASRDGQIRWQTRVPVAPHNAVLAGDRLYIGGRQGDVLAFDVSDG